MNQLLRKDIEKATEVVRETSYALWQSLLSFNGLLITILLGIASFKEIESNIIRIIIFTTILLLIISSIILLVNYHFVRKGYKIIYDFLYKGELPSDEQQKKNFRYAVSIHNWMNKSEIISYLVQGLATVLLLLISAYLLFPCIKKLDVIKKPNKSIKLNFQQKKVNVPTTESPKISTKSGN